MGKAESGHSLPPLLTPDTGSLNLLVRSRSKGALDTHAWSLSGNKGNVWQQAHVPINPSGPFQVSHLGLPLLTALPAWGRLPGAEEGSMQGWGDLPGRQRVKAGSRTSLTMLPAL